MTVEVALAVSVVSVAFAVFQGVINMKRNSKTDNRDEATQMTTVIVKLESISSDLSEIKAELKNTKDEVKELRDRLLVMEQSLKSAWRRLDEIKAIEK